MEITVSEQLLWSGASVCVGLSMGIMYCLLSLLYEVLGLTRWTTAFFDLLFSGLCAVAAFLFMVVFLDGNVRIYPWAGMLLGGLPVVHLTGTLRQKIQRRLRLRRRLRQSGRVLDGVQQLWIKKRKNRKKEQKNL
jgi:threonine/homoserine efflux transporter RhtA